MKFTVPSNSLNTSALRQACTRLNPCLGGNWETHLIWHLRQSVTIPAFRILQLSSEGELTMSSHTPSIGQKITLSTLNNKELKELICPIPYSADLVVQQRARRNVRVALSVNRYSRRHMLEALTSTEFSRKEEYCALLEQTKLTCVPKLCRERRSHRTKIFRHYGDGGHLIHMQVRPPYFL